MRGAVAVLVWGCGGDGHHPRPGPTHQTGNTAHTGAPADSGEETLDGVPRLDPWASYYGTLEVDEAGWRVAFADFDADGDDEAMISAPSNWRCSNDNYLAHVYVVDEETPSGPLEQVAPVRVTGLFNADRLGQWAGAGDVTGDGVVDLALWGQFSNTVGGAVSSAIAIYAGPLAGEIGAEEATTFLVHDRDYNIPVVPVPCGDVNADGVGDLCIGEGIDIVNPTRSQTVVFYGPIPPGQVDYATYDVMLWSDPSDNAGRSLVGGDDLTGDGLPDLLVGASDRNYPEGGVYLASALDQPGELALSEMPLWTGQFGDHLGDTMHLGGDFDGDGLGDAFLSAAAADDGRGRGYVATDKLGGPVEEVHLTFVGTQEDDWAGVDGGFGDFDGDGHDDLAVSSSRNIYSGMDQPGRVAVLRGPLLPGLYSESDADRVFRISDQPDSLGWRMDVGDLDGDGRADLVLGAPYDSTAAEHAGAVHLVLGGGLD